MKKKPKTMLRIAKPVNRVVTTSPAKLKAALPKRPKCRVDGHPDPEGGKFRCDKEGRSRGCCVNHYNIFSRLVRKKKTSWKKLEAQGLASPAGERVVSGVAKLVLDGKPKKMRKKIKKRA